MNEQAKAKTDFSGPQCICEGARYKLNAKRKSSFWEHFNGKECVVVSRHINAAIVEVQPTKEMILCQVRDLEPIAP